MAKFKFIILLFEIAYPVYAYTRNVDLKSNLCKFEFIFEIILGHEIGPQERQKWAKNQSSEISCQGPSKKIFFRLRAFVIVMCHAHIV